MIFGLKTVQNEMAENGSVGNWTVTKMIMISGVWSLGL